MSAPKNGLSRREFLKTGSASGAVLIVGFYWPSRLLAQQADQSAGAPNPFNAWVHIHSDGNVTLISAKSEMGQGIRTSLPMILADELDVDWKKVRVEQAPTDTRTYPHLGTGGSSSTRTSWMPLRKAGATARAMLIAAAAQTWGVSRETCKAELGVVTHGPSGRSLPYRELVGKAASLPQPDPSTVPLKDPKDFRYIGHSILRTDAPAKSDGSAVFGIDVRVPGLLHAVVARCPTFGGKMAHFDPKKALAVSGVRKVFEIPAVEKGGAHTAGGVAVVADTTWAAIQGRKALEIEWDHGPHVRENSTDLNKQLRASTLRPGEAVRDDGDAVAALAAATRKVEGDYELPFLAHATMEPMNCTADVRADRAEVWAPAQGPQWVQAIVAQVTGLPSESVTVHTTLMGGGFGRRYMADFGTEAAQISKAAGAPVQVLWTREDDMRHDFYRPASHHRLSGAIDERGLPVAWLHRMSSTSIGAFWHRASGPAASEVGGAANLPYAIPNLRMEYSPTPSSVPVAWWRSVEHSINAFVTESFLDELAAAASADPLEFRLRLLAGQRKVKNPVDPDDAPLDTGRLEAVLRLAAEKAGWKKSLPAGSARGLACHYSFGTYVAEVAEVSVEGGVPRVHRVVCAVDCGIPVNPDGIKAQMEGGIVFGLTAALKGEITIQSGAVVQSNFDDYELLEQKEMPEVEVHVVPSLESPSGAGEPGVAPIAAAVANALYAATGKRLRRLPIRPADLA